MILYNSERHMAANEDLTAKYFWNRHPPKLTSWIHPCARLCVLNPDSPGENTAFLANSRFVPTTLPADRQKVM